ncbi:MAG: LGFP repeat-containing protein [Kofleriaceae bacterium]
MLARTCSIPILAALLAAGCAVSGDDAAPPVEPSDPDPAAAALVAKGPRYAKIRDAAHARGFPRGYLLAGIANTETGLAHCWSEATWACQGPSSPDCGGGPVIAGSADGPCSIRQGGLGMFQFDAGTYDDTIGRYGASVLTIDGQIGHAIAYATNMVKISAYTTNAETDAKARAWLDTFDPRDPVRRDQWIKTVVRYYNGCQPGWSCWSPRLQTYSEGLSLAIDEPGGLGFWEPGTRCGNSPSTIGAIDAKYRALGGCGSVLGAPITAERGTPDGIGRYSVFERGSIYWTPTTGAFEVHGSIRDRWKDLGWEAGPLGYPISDETRTPDGVGRYNVFQGGSIYWSPSTGAYEVRGRIRDKWAELGWEAGPLGYPVSGEHDVPGGRRSQFQHGALVWTAATNTVAVEVTP